MLPVFNKHVSALETGGHAGSGIGYSALKVIDIASYIWRIKSIIASYRLTAYSTLTQKAK